MELDKGPAPVDVHKPANLSAGVKQGKRVIAMVLAFIVGGLSSILVTINARAGQIAGIQTWGSTIAFSVAEAFLTAMVLAEAWRKGLPVLRWKKWPKYHHILPGFCGAAFQIAGVFVPPVLGYASFWLCAVMGQLSAAMLLDHFGKAGAQKRHGVTAHRLLCLLIAAAGAILSVSDRLTGANAVSASPGLQAVLGIISILAGTLQPIQASLNRNAARRLPSPLQATWWSFAFGVLGTATAFGIQYAASSPETQEQVGPRIANAPAWSFLAGIPGICLILGALVLTGIVGSSAFFVLLIAGQLIGSLIIDSTGFLGSVVRPATGERIAGVLVVVVAAAAMQFDPPAACLKTFPFYGYELGVGACASAPKAAPNDTTAPANAATDPSNNEENASPALDANSNPLEADRTPVPSGPEEDAAIRGAAAAASAVTVATAPGSVTVELTEISSGTSKEE